MLPPDCLDQVVYIKNGEMYSKKGDQEIINTINY